MLKPFLLEDKSAIAYLGELVPHSSFASLGITNALDMLQVTPTDTALELTQATPAVSGAPDIYYQSRSTYGQTFARVVPTSGREAKAQVEEESSAPATGRRRDPLDIPRFLGRQNNQ